MKELQKTMERTIHYFFAEYRLVGKGRCIPLVRKNILNIKPARQSAPIL
jgi:hypothetical protein